MGAATRKRDLALSELIAFRLGAQEFCIDVTDVREIRGWSPATPLPHAPTFVLGVINLRGAVLPVIDLAGRLEMAPAEPGARHVIVVVEIERRVLGLLVDAVSDILSVSTEEMRPAPHLNAGVAVATGVLAIDGRMICLIDMERLFRTNESEAA